MKAKILKHKKIHTREVNVGDVVDIYWPAKVEFPRLVDAPFFTLSWKAGEFDIILEDKDFDALLAGIVK